MPPAAFLYPQNAPKSLAAGALSQTSLGSSYPLSLGIKGRLVLLNWYSHFLDQSYAPCDDDDDDLVSQHIKYSTFK